MRSTTPWDGAARRIRQLLKEGRYAAQDQLDAAWDNEYKELAEKLWNMRQNTDARAVDMGFLPFLSEMYMQGGFPEGSRQIADILRDKQKNAVLAAELEAFARAYDGDRKLMRSHTHSPGRILGILSGMDIQPEQFRAVGSQEPVRGSFITEDEIDSVLAQGSIVSEGKMRIYSYYMQGHEPKECTVFLRREYGTGGHRSGRCWEWHDSKGLRITGEDVFSSGREYGTVRLGWEKAEKRVRTLIKEGKYLNPKELAYLPEYEKRQLARQIYNFYYYDPNSTRKGYIPWDSEAALRDYRPMLDSPKLSDILYQDMAETFATALPEDTNGYGTMKEALEAMGAYVRGEYSLFTPLPEAVLRKQRMELGTAEKAEKEERAGEAAGSPGVPRGTGKESDVGRGTQEDSGRQGREKDEGELAAAAHALSRKQNQGTKEEQDGQLSFDFSVPETVPQPIGEPGTATAAGKEPGTGEALEPETDKGAVPVRGLVMEAETVTEPRDAAGPDVPDSSTDLEEAKRLIEGFCHEEYGAESMDFSNLEHLGIAWTSIEDGQREIEVMAEADLLNRSISKLVDDVCVEKREYGSLRELIDAELSVLDYGELLRLDNVAPEALLQAGIPKEQLQEVMGAVRLESGTVQEGTGTDGQEAALPDAASGETVEIEGGQIVEADSMAVYSKGLPHDIATREIPFESDRHNFRITDADFGMGGQKAKFQDNLAAIRTLKQVEAEGRLATREEQEILSRYVGWGGIAQAFDPDNGKWEKEYAGLKEALTPEEYASARGSVLNAHYTSPTIIGAVYEALRRMDFTPGNILEPSCGTGNFFGLLPEGYGSSRLYGVELDGLTGRIARQLYQKADITVDGFEHTEYPDDFFDLAVGNVPFGEYKVHDRRYDRQNLLIHDYFLTKAMDKVRPGGIMAFITTKGTLDKANSSAREGLAQKADLLGAIRLPNNAFLGNAGTSATADILFFQKRGSAPEKLPDWVHIGQTESGIPLNNYFLQHPEMVLGRMEFVSNRYGSETETACLPLEGASLKEQLAEAIHGIMMPDKVLLLMDAPGQERQGEGGIPADPDVRNFSFTEKDGKFYFRENSRMKPVELKGVPAARARGMIAIRDSARRLIDLQLNGAGDDEVEKGQAELNSLYDAFQKKYGLLNSPGNRQVFRNDSSYPLLSSLEVLDGEGNFKCKADMFSKRTINYRSTVSSVDTAVEALGVSIGERACVDLGFMASLMGGSEKIPQIVSDLKGIIFKDPATGPFDPEMQGDDWNKGWQAADEYLSGNVRTKLERARAAAEESPEFSVNVEELEKVQPREISAAEISVRIGAPWIDTKYYRQFLSDLLQVPARMRRGKFDVLYSETTGEWRIKKDNSMVSGTDTRVWNTYGSKRMNAYDIFEHTLNQRSVQIFDIRHNEEGKEIRVLNEKQTAIAQQKQEAIKGAFQDWIFKDPERRSDLCATYNRLFNSIRPREYDGRHIVFSGMNPEKKLEAHQRNAVARILYGKNTLLAHVVGAGKTYEMVAAAMEGRRLGLFRKSMIVVPNHLTEQWGSDFLVLYPGAKVLVATKRDFEQKNRKRFCARIATGDYDAVIIGHSQFEKIPLSAGRQEAIIQAQIDEIVDAIAEEKVEKSERFTIKQMERTKKSLEARLQKLHDKKKDDTVTFEELGVDHLFVDEAHYYKNLFLHTKMRNVAGISQTDAQKSSDMFTKCRYLDEITGGRGITFASGTPISNSVVELYTMMRYLQYDMLEEGLQDSSGGIRSLKHFDNWAATFGEQVTAVELKPEGTGFRLKTRFARFYNLPELMNCWKEAADIQTAEMLKLPVPEAEYITIQTESSKAQKEMVQELARRAERIRKEKLDPAIDNMLKVTSDGRKLALDQRLMNPLLPDDPGSKVNACVDNVFRIWQETAGTKGTQLIFSDLSTPKGKSEAKTESPELDIGTEGTDSGGEVAAVILGEESTMESSVYEDIRKKLLAKGIPLEEVAFIHEANTETQKAELFAKVRDGRVRVLLGSTQKMGQVPMSRQSWWLPMTWTVPGGRLIWSSGQDVSCAGAMRTAMCGFTAMSRRRRSMLTPGGWWSRSRSSSARS